MNEKEIQERMNEIKEEIKSRQEDLNDIITPGAYFYDTEEAQRLQDEIDQLQEEYAKLENTPTPEKVEELIKIFEERIKQLREEEKDFYGSYYLTDEMQELVNEDGELTEKVEQYKKVLDLFKEIEKVTKEIEDLDEEIQEYAGKFDENDGKPVAGANFIPDELLNEQKQKEEELERLKKELEELLETLGIEEDIDKYITHPQEKQDKNEPEPPEPGKKDNKVTPEPPEPGKRDENRNPVPPKPGKKDDKGTPEPPEPGTQLPVRSGLQVYRDLLNETGYIKGTKAIAAHDFINKFHFFGLNKLVAWGIRKATGRKDEVDRIVKILDEIQEKDPNDFELLMDDFLLQGNDTKNIMKYKVNEILLEAVEKKCNRDFANSKQALENESESLRKEFNDTQEKLKTCSPEEEVVLNNKLVQCGILIAENKNKRDKLEMRGRRIQEGKEDKSYDRKNNIKGGLKANRNPNNREEINRLADIELAKLKAIQKGDMLNAFLAHNQMEKYASSKTSHDLDRKGRVKRSVGAFEAPEGEITIISKTRNMTPELLGALAQIGTVAGVSFALNNGIANANQKTVDQAISSQEKTVNAQINQINAANKGVSIDQKTIQTAQDSMKSDVLFTHESGERAANLATDFSTGAHAGPGSAYANLDANYMKTTESMLDAANKFKPSGATKAEQLASILKQKEELLRQGSGTFKGVADSAKQFYGGPHGVMSLGGVDHTATAALEGSAELYTNAQADLYHLMAEMISQGNTQPIANIAMNSPKLINPALLSLLGIAPAVEMTATEQVAGRRDRHISDKDKDDEGMEPEE